jgi:hypothetical protein
MNAFQNETLIQAEMRLGVGAAGFASNCGGPQLAK